MKDLNRRAWRGVAMACSLVFPFTLLADSKECDPALLQPDRIASFFDEKRIHSIAALLKALPECYLANHVSIYHSSSLQCATPKAPRTVIYLPEPDGNTRCSFNSGKKEDYREFYEKNPNIDCHENTLECERFVGGDQARFEYYEVKFSHDDQGKPYDPKAVHNGPKKFEVSGVNPPQCMTACHRGLAEPGGKPDPRPVMEIYPLWAGFYGSHHDELFRGRGIASEIRDFQTWYLPYKKTNARYSALPELVDDKLQPKERSKWTRGKPTIDLHNELEAQNYQRIARKFTEQPTRDRIWPFRYAILGALACNDDTDTFRGKDDLERLYDDAAKPDAAARFSIESFIPDEVRKGFRETYARTAKTALLQHRGNLQHQADLEKKLTGELPDEENTILKRALENDPNAPISSYRLAAGQDFANATRLAYLATNLGIPTDDWSMTFRHTLQFGAGSHNPQQILTHLLPRLLDGEADQSFKDLDRGWGTIHVDQCKRLRDKSLATLKRAMEEGKLAIGPAPAKTTRESSSGPIARRGSCELPSPPALVNDCVRCHVNGDERYFPFHDPKTLSARLRQPVGKDNPKSLVAEINAQVRSGRMPYHIKTTAKQKGQLIGYFTQLSKVTCPAADDKGAKRKGLDGAH